MTREETREELEAIARSIEDDVRAAQTRDQHLRACQRLAEVRTLAAKLTDPPPG